MFRMPLRRLVGRVAVASLALAAPVALTPTPASAATTDLLISEYIEGSSFNKAIEIYNGTGASVDLLVVPPGALQQRGGDGQPVDRT